MRSSVLACAVVLCLCPLGAYAEDKDVKKNTEVKAPEMKLKDASFASPGGRILSDARYLRPVHRCAQADPRFCRPIGNI